LERTFWNAALIHFSRIRLRSTIEISSKESTRGKRKRSPSIDSELLRSRAIIAHAADAAPRRVASRRIVATYNLQKRPRTAVGATAYERAGMLRVKKEGMRESRRCRSLMIRNQ